MSRLIIVSGASIGLILLVAFLATRLVRSRARGMSIRMQIFIALALVVGAFAFGLGVIVLDRIEARGERFALAAATEKAHVMAQLLGAEMDQHGLALAELAKQLPRRAEEHHLQGVELYSDDGRCLYRSASLAPTGRARLVSAQATIRARGREQGQLRVGKTTVLMDRLVRDFAPTILVISLVLGAAAAVAAIWIGRTIAGPIEAISLFAERISAGTERAALPPIPRGREVTRLTHSVESMRRQLSGRPFVETFAADLSHELKNPVAAIRATAEILEDAALEEPDEARRFIRRIRESVARIERLLEELLTLARIESQGVQAYPRIELSELLTQVVQDCSLPSRIEMDCQTGLSVRGQAPWLGRAVGNLLENSLLHSSPEAPVQVVLLQEGGEACIRVRNPGVIVRHARTELFRRFFTTREDKGGTGLGLPIAQAVAEAHRGRLELQSAGPPEVIFELHLPLVI